MARTTAPALSFGASGQIAKTMVYGSWRGVPYVRRHVIPANPQSSAQTEVRSLFTWLNQVWKNSPTLAINPWNSFATGQKFVGRNSFIGKNVQILQGLTVVTAMLFSPGSKGGPAPTAVVGTGGVGQISVAITAPSIPTGWSITNYIAAAIAQQDPQTEALYVISALSNASSPVVITGLAADVYVCSGWIEWTKPDGTTAYSVSINDTATVT